MDLPCLNFCFAQLFGRAGELFNQHLRVPAKAHRCYSGNKY
jgi:hypothetical protein